MDVSGVEESEHPVGLASCAVAGGDVSSWLTGSRDRPHPEPVSAAAPRRRRCHLDVVRHIVTDATAPATGGGPAAAIGPTARRTSSGQAALAYAVASGAKSLAVRRASPTRSRPAPTLLRSGRSRLRGRVRRQISCGQASLAYGGSPAWTRRACGRLEAGPRRLPVGEPRLRGREVRRLPRWGPALEVGVPAVATPVPEDRCMVEPSINPCAPRQGLHNGTWIARRRPLRRIRSFSVRRDGRPRSGPGPLAA
jgi:hypothetical protein